MDPFLQDPDPRINFSAAQAVELPDVENSSLVDLLRFWTAHYPDQVAVTFLVDGETQEATLTFAQWDKKARQIAAALQRKVKFGERALLIYPNNLEFLAGFMGCLYAGVIAVLVIPPKPGFPLVDQQAVAADAGSTLILTTKGYLAALQPQIEANPDLKACEWLATDDLDPAADAQDWRVPEQLTSDTLAYIIYTSGSTSQPKGILKSHRRFLSDQMPKAAIWGAKPWKKMVVWMPLHHSGGTEACLCALSMGTPVVLMRPDSFTERPVRWLQAISRYKAYLAVGASFAYQYCATRITPEERATLDLSSWEIAINVAERVETAVLERFVAAFAPCGFRREAFHPSYGLSEAGAVSGKLSQQGDFLCSIQRKALEENRVALAEPGDAAALVYANCGAITPGKCVVIVNPKTLQQCAPDQVGEVWVSGPSLAVGYWNKPEETRQAFQAYLADSGEGPYLRSGDMGFLIDGELVITGRLKEMIILHGRNYYANDFEQTVEPCHPALQPGGGAACAVVHNEEEQLAIFHEVKPDFAYLNVNEVVAAIRKGVADVYGVPVYAVILVKKGGLPRTSTNKIQRSSCWEAYQANDMPVILASLLDQKPLKAEPFKAVGLADEVETGILKIWEELLGVQGFSTDANFFVLGGDSLKGALCLAHIQQAFGVDLPAGTIYQAPTVAQQVQLVQAALAHKSSPAPAWSPLIRLQEEQDGRAPLFLFHGVAGVVTIYTDLARALAGEQTVYGVQASGSNPALPIHRRIDQMAAYYVEAIRSMQPSGPYRLGGFCFGGLVAYEAACQLQERGEAVDSLIIIDSNAPLPSNDWSLLNLRQDLNFLRNLPHVVKFLFSLSPQAWSKMLRRRVFRPISHIEDLPAEMYDLLEDPSKLPPLLQEVMQADIKAAGDYMPRVYQGRVTIFRGEKMDLLRGYDPLMGWSRLARGGVDLHVIMGHHESLLHPPYVKMLAEQIMRCLGA